MKLKDFIELVNRYDSRIEVLIGNEWYNDTVEVLERINTAKENTGYDGEYKNYPVVGVDAVEYGELRLWLGDKEEQ